MKKMLIGIVGIPIQLKKRRDFIKEFFSTGLTDSLRLKTKEFIKNKTKNIDLEINILDLGELIESEYVLTKKSRLTGISKSILDELAKKLKKMIKDLDFVIVFGGAHTGAYVLYHLPGRVERYDIHDDDYEVDMPFHTSYFRHITSLKELSQISNHDLMDGLLIDYTKAKGDIFDIDIDYLIPSVYCRLKKNDVKNNFQKIKDDIHEAKPKIIGFFELQNMNVTDEYCELLLSLIWEGINSIKDKVI